MFILFAIYLLSFKYPETIPHPADADEFRFPLLPPPQIKVSMTGEI